MARLCLCKTEGAAYIGTCYFFVGQKFFLQRVRYLDLIFYGGQDRMNKAV